MSNKKQDKEAFYKKIQKEQMLIDIDEFARKKLEGEEDDILGNNKGLS
ncbi:hypothetical protein [Clostridium sp. 1001271B_151109_B4]|nr:hypothetical protein [Clostridium sp. 1001271B_151109_B4]